MNYEEFKYYNSQSLHSGLVRKATIEDRQFKEDTCKIFGRTLKISNVVQDVLSQKYCLTNASLLTQWKGFRNTTESKSKNNIKDSALNKYLSVQAVEADNVPFDVIFNPKGNGQPEIYSYRNKKEAENHLNMFKDDDSGIYRNITLLNPQKNEVYRILYFAGDSDICTLDLSKDDIVRLKAVFCSCEQERKYIYTVKNINDHSNTCEICCLNSNLALGSIERVGLEMIVITGKKIQDLLKRG